MVRKSTVIKGTVSPVQDNLIVVPTESLWFGYMAPHFYDFS
jgi:hypothetical protein